MRHKWIDRWKGLLILLVVFGHAVGAAGNLSEGFTADVLLKVRHFVYLFHMPAFFVLAGMCWNPFVGRDGIDGVKRFLCRRSFRLMVPYLIFGVISWCVFDVMNGTWNELPGQMRHLIIADGQYKCNSVLWFLPVMFTVLLFSLLFDSVFCRLSEKIVQVSIGGVVVIDFFVFFILRYNHIGDLPLMPLNISKYLCFFMIGRMMKENIPVVRSVLFVFLVFVLCVPVFVHYNTRPFLGYSMWMAQGISGALVSAAIVRAMPDKWFVWLEWIGAMSMGIMLIHKFPMVAIQEYIPIVRSLFGVDLPLALSGSVFVFFCATILSVIATLVAKWIVPWSIGEHKHKHALIKG